jgi:hypothetical protein
MRWRGDLSLNLSRSWRKQSCFLFLQVRFIEQYSQKGGSGGASGGRFGGSAGSKLHVVRVDGAGVPLESEVGGSESYSVSMQETGTEGRRRFRLGLLF